MNKTDQLKYDLLAKGLRYVGTRGNLTGPICFIGEAPGADEDQAGIPFIGASGRELDKMLSEVSISGGDCWWTNPYKTRPPENKFDRLHELGIPLTQFEDQFWEELDAYKPTFLVPLGATPLGLICPATIPKGKKRAAISSYRGSILRSPRLTWDHYVIPAYHPAFLFRDWSERQIDVLCLAKLHEEFAYWKSHHALQPLPQRQLIAEPGADDAIDYLRRILQTSHETLVSIDIENIGIYKGKHATKQRNRIPYVIGFSIIPSYGMSIGLGDYDVRKAAQIWFLIQDILLKKRQVGQNYYTHDLPWLQYIGFKTNAQLIDDTLVRHHCLWPELSHKLEFQTFQYTRQVYYKDEGRNWTVKERTKMKEYNCKDVCVTLEIYQRQEEEFLARGLAA